MAHGNAWVETTVILERELWLPRMVARITHVRTMDTVWGIKTGAAFSVAATNALRAFG